MPIYGAIGNHDVHPTNSFPRSTSSFANASDWTFDLHAKYWEPSIGAESAQQARHQSGSFSYVHPKTHLKIISFNSNYAYKANFWLYDSDNWTPDPNGLFRWLATELQAAEDAGQRAWIIAHMSTGKSDFMQDQSALFDQIVQRYHKTVRRSVFRQDA
jgi:sphingomyelin phosphodiesterase